MSRSRIDFQIGQRTEILREDTLDARSEALCRDRESETTATTRGEVFAVHSDSGAQISSVQKGKSSQQREGVR
jgi:hypothetical protein